MGIVKSAGKVYERVRDYSNKSADTDSMTDRDSGLPKGLVPNRVFDGVYTSPGDGKFDPRDCSNPRNATSPSCGYNPVSAIPFDPGFGIKKTKCGVVVELAPTIAFLEFPPVHAAYINPECRDAYEAKYQKKTPIQPTEQPGTPYVPPPVEPANSINAILQDECYYIIELGSSNKYDKLRNHTPTDTIRYFEIQVLGIIFKGWHTGKLPIVQGITKFEILFNGLIVMKEPRYNSIGFQQYSCWGEDFLPDGNGGCPLTPFDFPQDYYRGWHNIWYAECQSKMKTGSYLCNGGGIDGYNLYIRDYVEGGFRTFYEADYLSQKGFTMGQIDYRYGLLTGHSTPSPNQFMFGAYGAAIKPYLDHIKGKSQITEYFVRNYYEVNCPTSKRYWNPSPDCYPQPAEDCCDSQNANCYGEEDMGCCEDKNKDIDAKLDKILRNQGKFPVSVSVWDDDPTKPKRQQANKNLSDISASIEHLNKQLQRTMQILGIEEFTIEYPETVIIPQAQSNLEKIWAWFSPKKSRKIANLAQLIDWGNDQQSAVLGQWQQYVEYPGKPDGKGKPTTEKVVLPDVATTLRELFKMTASTIQMAGLNTDIQAKALATSTNNSVMVLEALERIKDVQTYMDYVTVERSKRLPIQVSPGEKSNNLKKYLTPSEASVVFDQWDAANDESMQEALDSIKQTLVVVLAQLGGEGKNK